MKLVADLESAKLILQSAYEPELKRIREERGEADAQRMIQIMTQKRKKKGGKKRGSLPHSDEKGLQCETH